MKAEWGEKWFRSQDKRAKKHKRTCGVWCKFIMGIKGVTEGMETRVREASDRKRRALKKCHG